MDSAIIFILYSTLFIVVIIGLLIWKKSIQKTDELTRKNKDLLINDEKKDNFLSFATHQIRSPLTSVKWGLAELKENYSKDMVQKLEMITDDLISTVNDLLDISKMEQEGFVMNFETIELSDLISNVINEFKIVAERKNIKIIWNGMTTPVFVLADKIKLQQVFVNLIDNAIKYTEKGFITVSLEKDLKTVKAKVSDTGPGISHDEIKEIFTKFLRGAAGKASKSGAGLGLYLAKNIVEAHKGNISVRSEGVGKGSEFIVELPTKQ